MSELSHKQKLLLERYRDGQCGFLASYRAERLLENSEAAVDYLGRVESLGSTVVRCWPERSTDLWDRVEARIIALQGASENVSVAQRGGLSRDSLSQQESSQQGLLASFAGRLAASSKSWSQVLPKPVIGATALIVLVPALFMFAMQESDITGERSGALLTRQGASSMQEAGAANILSMRATPVSLPDGYFQSEMASFSARDLLAGGSQQDFPVRLDWVRSAGDARVLQGRDGSSSAPVFWVSKEPRSAIESEEVLEATSRKTLFLQPRADRLSAERGSGGQSTGRPSGAPRFVSEMEGLGREPTLARDPSYSALCSGLQSSPECLGGADY